MSRAALIRLLVGLGGGMLTLWVFWSIPSPGIAYPAALAVFVASSVLSERLYRRMASRDEQRRDLTDRVRNPPS